MSEAGKSIRLSKAAIEFNVGMATIVDFLHKKGVKIDSNPNTKLTPDAYAMLAKEYASEKQVKEVSKKLEIEFTQHRTISIDDKPEARQGGYDHDDSEELFIRNVSLDKGKAPKAPKAVEEPVKPKAEEKPAPKEEPAAPKEEPAKAEAPKAKPEVKETVEAAPAEPEAAAEETGDDKKSGLKVLGKIDLPAAKAKGKKKATKEKEEKAVEPEPEKVAETETPAPAAETLTEEAQTAEAPAEAGAPEKEEEKPVEEQSNFLKTQFRKLDGPTILGSMKLPEPKKAEPKKPVASSSDDALRAKKKKRKRIKKTGEVVQETDTSQKPKHPQTGDKPRRGHKPEPKQELSDEEIQKQIKETLQRLSSGGKSKASKHRREKRSAISQQMAEQAQLAMDEEKVIKVTEFVTANELANLMNVQVNQVISTCLSLGLFVSINQRLDAETIVLVADEFGYSVKFVDAEVSEELERIEEPDRPEDMRPRAPIVTVMGHVDHGKTSLLDYIRNANVISGEAGGITQHIGAYEVKLESGKYITFLDTPGHEAFTAMRARGAKITDIVIIVVAADDTVMPQTIEAINHAQAAGVPIVFAINKIDKPSANPEKIKEELSKINILVEDWGGKYQSQEISAKKGINIELLLEKVMLEAELLELKANPNKLASGTVIESSLDKGRGYVSKILVQEGTLRVGDLMLAGTTFGRVKAMYNERNTPIKEAGPSEPLLLLGLNGAPQAGDTFKVMPDEREAKALATKRQQLLREQGIRTQKHITLEEIGRRIAIGDFKELNIIVKADVDGSVEALSDSLLRLSTPEVQVNIIHKSVGAITESDVMLASASNAIVVGFQVRPTQSARKIAESEQIDIRTYSIIYTAINEIKAAIEGMLSPEIEEKIICNIEVREVFHISKVGTVAGCMVLDGKVTRNTRIRVIRDGIVIHTGTLGSLKRFKDDVKEVSAGYECGLNINNFNDLKIGDIIEGFEEVEVKRKL